MYQYRAKIERVVDGDTIDVNIDLGFNIWVKKRIRLKGLNSPETRTKDDREKVCGKAATVLLEDILERAILDDREIIIHTDKDKEGKYGRPLADITTIKFNDDDPICNINQVLPALEDSGLYMKYGTKWADLTEEQKEIMYSVASDLLDGNE